MARRRSRRSYGYGPYVSVEEKRAKALKKIEQLKKKNPDIRPVLIEGRTLAKSFWAKSWNQNLERYADYSNRIERGRSYVRHRAVLDLRVEKGKIRSLVQGSVGSPYKVEIGIDAVHPGDWKRVGNACLGKIDSLPELLAGKFPKDLIEIFMEKGRGLFPAPKEIHFACSCPDIASMCKHVAATLYGMGARIDEDPSLFFLLRGVDIQDLITSAMEESTRDLLGKAQSGDRKVVDTEDLSELFGIEMDDGFASPAEKMKGARPKTTAGKKRKGKVAAPKKTKAASAGESSPGKKSKAVAPDLSRSDAGPARKKGRPASADSQKKRVAVTPAERKPSVKAVKKPTEKAVRKTAGKQVASTGKKKTETTSGKISNGMPNRKSPFDTVVGVIRRRTVKGIGVAEIKEKTGLTETQIRNAIYRARSKGLIENQARGLFIKGANAPM